MLVTTGERNFLVDLGAAHDCASWALIGGGLCAARYVGWYEMQEVELPLHVDPLVCLRQRIRDAGHPEENIVALMTSRNLRSVVSVMREAEGIRMTCVATVGLSNALRVGDSPSATPVTSGTINLLCVCSVPLSLPATLEALSLVVEARTLAIHEAEIPSQISAISATGTGTDCVVMASSRETALPPAEYAGKHTVIGHLLGATVYAAVTQGAHTWKRERAAGTLRMPTHLQVE